MIDVKIGLELGELETSNVTFEQADFALRGKGLVPLSGLRIDLRKQISDV